MVKTSFAVLTLLTLGVAIGRFTLQPVARAQTGCSAASLKGSYALSMSGFFYDPDGIQGVYGAAGLAVADGTGGITGTETLNLDGTPARGLQFTGSYTVNNDCTGSLSLKDSQGNAIVNMDLVIAGGGKNVSLVDYDPNVIVNGTATLQ